MASMSRAVMTSMMGSKDSLRISLAAFSAHVVAWLPSLPCVTKAKQNDNSQTLATC